MAGRRGRRLRELLYDREETRGYWKLEQEALDRTPWCSGCGRGYGTVVRQAILNETDGRMGRITLIGTAQTWKRA